MEDRAPVSREMMHRHNDPNPENLSGTAELVLHVSR